MPSINDFAARGRVTQAKDGSVLFLPSNTRYQLELKTAGKFDGAVDRPIDATIRATARKVWTVPSGGLFVTPIVGTPRIVQGRVKFLDQRHLVLHAGTTFVIELPAEQTALDLINGPIAVGSLVNATLLPGATFEAKVAAPTAT